MQHHYHHPPPSTAVHTFDDLKRFVENFPLIDNHAHPLLKPHFSAKHPLESITSEAHGAALGDVFNSLAHIRAVKQLSEILGCPPTWEDFKRARAERDPDEWNRLCLSGIQCILFDDGLDKGTALGYDSHDLWTIERNKRIVRIETVAEEVLYMLLSNSSFIQSTDEMKSVMWMEAFQSSILDALKRPEVVGLKSIICYRTGLNIDPPPPPETKSSYLREFVYWMKASQAAFKRGGSCRLKNKVLNDWVVWTVCDLNKEYKKPLQFHTGLGDNDLNLIRANPSHLQTLIKAHSDKQFVLLHSGYPYVREAGYLATVYDNVYLDFGEVFPMLSKDGQKGVIKQMLELTPITKLLWSSDAHWFPETFVLANLQLREVMLEVLTKRVQRGIFTIPHAAELVRQLFFENSNRLYKLGLQPKWQILDIRPQIPQKSFHSLIAKTKEWDAKFVRMHWVDYSNTVRLRIMPIREVRRLVERGSWNFSITKASLSLFHDDAEVSDASNTGKYMVHPDAVSIRKSPHAGHASVFCDIFNDGGSSLPIDPRSALQAAVFRAHRVHEIDFLVGFEIEFVLMDRNPDGTVVGAPRPHAHSWSNASAMTPQRTTVIDDIVAALDAAGIDVSMYHPESAPGQWEIVTAPLTPLVAVDTLYHSRLIIQHIAAQHNLRASFHPKPFPNIIGTAIHTHFSLTSGRRHQNSFIAGILSHFSALVAFSMGSVASFDRRADSCWAGGTWIAWGNENRETPLRRIDAGDAHWELRAVDGTANMYLFLAALLQAGCLGVARHSVLQPGVNGDPARMSPEERRRLGVVDALPASLEEAVQALDADVDLAKVLGEELVMRYVKFKKEEAKKDVALRSEADAWEREVERY